MTDLRAGTLLIELHCRLCGQVYTPSRADILAGPETYHRCLACRVASQPLPYDCIGPGCAVIVDGRTYRCNGCEWWR